MRSYVKKLLPIVSIIIILFVIVYANCCLIVNGDASPQWRNQKQSALVIPQGAYISLQAEGMDTTSLSKAVLSTNETGVWRN